MSEEATALLQAQNQHIRTAVQELQADARRRADAGVPETANETDLTTSQVSEINEQLYTALWKWRWSWKRLRGLAPTATSVGPVHGGTCERSIERHPVSWASETHRSQWAMEKVKDLTRRDTSRKDATGKQLTLADDIRMASLEALLPSDLKKKIRAEIVRHCEARGVVYERQTWRTWSVSYGS